MSTAETAGPKSGPRPGPAGGASRARGLAELARFFFGLSVVGFGGPAAHLAIMQRELVERRAWLTQAEFLDLLGATNLIPGPNSTEMAIHIGYRRAGVLGSLVAGGCFIGPAALITLCAAWLYVRYGGLPRVQPMLQGIQAGVVAVIGLAAGSLGRTALPRPGLWGLAALAFAAALAGLPEILVFFGGGLLYVAARQLGERFPARRPPGGAATVAGLLLFSAGGGVAPSAAMAVASAATPATAGAVSLPALGWFFVKVGSVIYGSGYVLVPLLLRGLVEEHHWLSRSVLLDAVAIGQLTPGPVFTTATCVGYLLRGGAGAAVATLGIFAPSFVLVWLLVALLRRLAHSRPLRQFLDGVNACSLAVLVATACLLLYGERGSPGWLGFSVLAFVIGYRVRLNPSWLIVAGAVAGGVVGAVVFPPAG